MSSPLSTTALAVHDLGLAAGFGGSLFGKLALSPAVEVINSEAERREVLHAAWGNYNLVSGLSAAAVGLSWFAGRSALSGKEADSRGLTVAKDVLTGTMVASGIAAYAGGRKLSYQTDSRRGEGVDYSKTRRFVANAGTVNLIATAGVIAITALLNMRAGRSIKWSFLSRILP